ncbi:MAG: proteasome accessory factor PafA2 family protein [Verrucomicrobiae bacterium]|nr:proteasome accessory factor PafA2 family protein [Verrucomicrobiae bacterium]
MNRIVGVETEYGCLVNQEERAGGPDAFPIRVKNHIFRTEELGVIDLHYRDFEEPPGNGGFLLNGGRVYLDMGHLEYSSPECRSIYDIVLYDRAGDTMLQNALLRMNLEHRVSFLKNNIDHHTGATFGCHENYLMRRDASFTPSIVAALLSFLVTRQIYTGAGRVGVAHPFSMEEVHPKKSIHFQISQRADHIVNDIYQWVQFNRAIINARDEPLADGREYRRLHLLLGDSNMAEYANVLKFGTTALVLDLLESGIHPKKVAIADAVSTMREISHDPSRKWLVRLESGGHQSALDIQRAFCELAVTTFRGRDAETDQILQKWMDTLEALSKQDYEALVGKIDWITKEWLLGLFMQADDLTWNDPWLKSLDLEYHDLDSSRGLYFGVEQSNYGWRWTKPEDIASAIRTPPADTRATGRGLAISKLQKRISSYIINWDSITLENGKPISMMDPLRTYQQEIQAAFAKVRESDKPAGPS